MKLKKLFLLFAILFAGQSFASDTLRVKSSVKNVTLYFSGAEVFREGNVALGKGKQSIQINWISEFLCGSF
jgi:hypothetical protein